MRNVTILGATGSVGRAALDVLSMHPDKLRAAGLTAGRNAARLAEAALRLRPAAVALEDADGEGELRERLRGADTAIFAGPGAAAALAAEIPADLAVAAIAGVAGLAPTLAAARAGRDLALANKEALVVGGGWFMEEIRIAGARLLPVDSEHSGLFRCLAGRAPAEVRRVTLTASGGPFLDWPAERIRAATAADALRHPTWSMGRKITIDSATLANKALEIIEAHWLFDIPYDKLSAVVHPQSLVHGWIELADGSLLMHASAPDMRIPLQYAMLYPKQGPRPLARLDLSAVGGLGFAAIDGERFPLFGLGMQAGRRGGVWPAIYNGANEAAVAALLAGRTTIGGLTDAVARALEEAAAGASASPDNLEAALEAGRRAYDWTSSETFG